MITTLNGSLRSLAAATCALAILTGAATAQDNKLIGAALADQKSLFYIAAGDCWYNNRARYCSSRRIQLRRLPASRLRTRRACPS
jgi:hypothetical protein